MSFGVLMVLAGSIAAIAVVTNNPVLVVGAMIVSPDYGPMAALSVALVNRAWRPAWRSLRALALGFPMAAVAALLLTLAARGLGRIPAAYLAGERPMTGLLIGANLGAFVVAFVAGAAGIIALGRAKSGAVVVASSAGGRRQRILQRSSSSKPSSSSSSRTSSKLLALCHSWRASQRSCDSNTRSARSTCATSVQSTPVA